LNSISNGNYRMWRSDTNAWTAQQASPTFSVIPGASQRFEQRVVRTPAQEHTHNDSAWSDQLTWTLPSYTISGLGTHTHNGVNAWTASTNNTSRFHGSAHTISISTVGNHVFRDVNVTGSGARQDPNFTQTNRQRRFLVDSLTANVNIPVTVWPAYDITYSQGTAPTANPQQGGAITAPTITGDHLFKIHDQVRILPTVVFLVPNHATYGRNWDQVGWREGSSQMLANRNFTATPASMIFGAGTGSTDASRTIPTNINRAITLFPIWAPQETRVNFHLGVVPPGSGTIAGANTFQTRFTGQALTYPVRTDNQGFPHFVVRTGMLWEQVGWIRQSPNADVPIANRVVGPLATTFPAGTVLNGHHIPVGTNFEAWGTTRTYFPVWRRVITHGNVTINFVGGHDGFKADALTDLDENLSATMPFTVSTVTNQIYHADPCTRITLPSVTDMNTLGSPHDLTFQGWFIRTSWATATTQINPNPDGTFTIPWTQGIFAANGWEPFILIEARWASKT
jgi:hypothetical protein